MSVIRMSFVECTYCFTVGPAGQNAVEARRLATGKGWDVRRPTPGRQLTGIDRCPQCRARQDEGATC